MADLHHFVERIRPFPSPDALAPETMSDPESRALAGLTASPDELRVRLGARILTLGYRTRGRKQLTVRQLADCVALVLRCDNGGAYRMKTARNDIGAAPDTPAGLEDARALVIPPAGRVARLSGASVTGGIVTTAEGLTILESLDNTLTAAHFGPFTRDARGTLLQSKPRFSMTRRLRGGPAVLLKQPFDADYGRWLIEGLPRLALVEDHFDLRDLSFIISAVQGPMRSHFEDSLALFGIRPEQIVEVGDETLVVDDLIYPAPLTNRDAIVAPRCLDVLEQVATRVRADPMGAQRIYVSRHAPSTGRIGNEAAIIACVERHGFTVVEPETLSLFQQIGLFRQARIVVGAPGAALCNAMFATQNLTLFALAGDAASDAMLAGLMSLKDGQLVALHGEPGQAGTTDRTIDMVRFERMLAAIIAGPP